jgi:FAD/FMN-containing dehydrogenase
MSKTSPDSASLIEKFRAIVGTNAVLTESSDVAPYFLDHRELFTGTGVCVVRPKTTEEVSKVVTLCAQHKVPIVPQGGNTGLVGGSVPDDSSTAVVLSLGRMNTIRNLDAINSTMTVEAGCILASLQEAARNAKRLFPLSLGAEGSCMIGGNISTNAGGVGVLKYGNTRDLVLGLEVVMPDGRIWDGLNALRKDNTGYDLKQLFIGAEGTLGIVTAAVLKLFPEPAASETVFMAVPELDDVMELLADARAASGDCVTAFELVPRLGLELVLKHFEDTRTPVETVTPWYVLMEWSAGEGAGDADNALRQSLETFLEGRFEAGVISDAALAASEAQVQDLWKLREVLPESQTREGGSIKHDVSVPVSQVASFITRASAMLENHMPGIRVFPFGHVGDGNIHFNVTQPVGMTKTDFHKHWEEINRLVHDLVMEMHGSFSAEHGIGRLKRNELAHYGSDMKLDLMRRIKAALDPDGLMNPGKVL